MMAVSVDPHTIKMLLSLGELHFEILYYLMYVWCVCLTESLRLFVLYVILFRIHGHSCDHHTTFPFRFDLFPGDKQS